jgi:hypothetical protein
VAERPIGEVYLWNEMDARNWEAPRGKGRVDIYWNRMNAKNWCEIPPPTFRPPPLKYTARVGRRWSWKTGQHREISHNWHKCDNSCATRPQDPVGWSVKWLGSVFQLGVFWQFKSWQRVSSLFQMPVCASVAGHVAGRLGHFFNSPLRGCKLCRD